MTLTNAKRPWRGSPLASRASLVGLAAGLLAAFSGVQAAPTPAVAHVVAAIAQAAPANSLDPSRRLPGTIAVSSIDFNRGQGGAGKLTIRFSGAGAIVDMQDRGGTLIVEMPNVELPKNLQRPLSVNDFATPVEKVAPYAVGVGGSRLVLDVSGSYKPMAFQSGNEYVLEVAPSSAAGASGSARTARSRAVANALDTPKYTGKPVTFNFQDVPVRTVLQLIAEETGANLVASDSVSGNVTLRLVNVPWDQALDIVLRARGLDKRRDGNVLWVAPQKELAEYELAVNQARIAVENSSEMITAYLPVSYANADDVKKLLTGDAGQNRSGSANGSDTGIMAQRGLLSARGSISADPRTNTLIIHDTPERIEDIKKFLAIIDRPVDQVVIEARIVIANESFARELGARFGISGAAGDPGDRSSVGFGGNLEASQANAQSRADSIFNNTGTDKSPPFNVTRGLMTNMPSTLVGGSGSLALSILNAGHMLDVELSAMQTEGRGEIISNPRIVTTNQKEALIRQGDQIGYLTVTGGTNSNAPSVQFKDAILQMKVTPTITADGRVFLDMDVLKDDLAGFINTGVGQVPQITTRQVTTSVLVDDGQTVVIGGVYEFKDQQDLSKVPFLADLPVIGNLFKKRGRSKSKAELLIMVTPRVIRVAQRAGN
ncbi:MAG: type IV pilus secretin PilQ family protein [Luteimonas sp.]